MERILMPQSITRTIERLNTIYHRYVSISESTLATERIRYTAQRIRPFLDRFEKFKSDLLQDNSYVLTYETGNIYEENVKLMRTIFSFYEPLCGDDIATIENDVIIFGTLKNKLESIALSKSQQAINEASCILKFINNAVSCSWGQSDEPYRIKEFRLVPNLQTFQSLIEKRCEEELTSGEDLSVRFSTIRMSFKPINYPEIYESKAISKVYENFVQECCKCCDIDDYIKMFNLWHDVRPTAVYHIYIGN